MFLAFVFLVGLAIMFWGHPPHWAGEAEAPITVVAGVVALYHFVILANALSQRYHPNTWDRLHRAHAMARKPKSRSSDPRHVRT